MISLPSSRRRFLKMAGLTIGSAALAGCQSKPSLFGGNSDVTVAVGPGNVIKFDPDVIRITAGTTITWDWKSSNHNIVASTIPEDASWGGTPGDAEITYGPGYTYEKSFSVVGEYDYYCQPHVSDGMVGKVTVE